MRCNVSAGEVSGACEGAGALKAQRGWPRSTRCRSTRLVPSYGSSGGISSTSGRSTGPPGSRRRRAGRRLVVDVKLLGALPDRVPSFARTKLAVSLWYCSGTAFPSRDCPPCRTPPSKWCLHFASSCDVRKRRGSPAPGSTSRAWTPRPTRVLGGAQWVRPFLRGRVQPALLCIGRRVVRTLRPAEG